MATLLVVILGVVIAHFVIKDIESLAASQRKYKADKRRYAEQKSMLHVHAALAAQRAAKEKRDRDYPTWPEGAHSPWSPLISENKAKKSLPLTEEEYRYMDEMFHPERYPEKYPPVYPSGWHRKKQGTLNSPTGRRSLRWVPVTKEKSNHACPYRAREHVGATLRH
jgi:hypothetical protein